MSERQRRWDECSGDPCICPKPARIETQLTHVAKGAEYANRVWVEWLAAIGYGVDFTHTPPPPCEPDDLAEVYAETDGESADDWIAILLDGNTPGGWYGNDLEREI